MEFTALNQIVLAGVPQGIVGLAIFLVRTVNIDSLFYLSDAGQVISVPITLMNHYVYKYNEPYLQKQYYLPPLPTELKLRNHA
ncbi:MAG: YbgA family protein [Desulfobulbaceae bacterium]|nr:YbgA family protein [Desulfobulbaceae bacterium]